MNDDEYRRKLHRELMDDMSEFILGWHKQGKCDCMKDETEEITMFIVVPCNHVRDAQWKVFKKRINELGELFQEHWHNKLHDASTPIEGGDK